MKLATQKKFTWRLVVQAFFRVVVNPIFDKSYFFRSRFLGSLTNTIFVLGGIFFLFGNVYNGNIQLLLATVISTNSIAELVISAILTLAIVPRLQTLKK
ncbi:membrane protein [Streptococcus pneumoniae]|nr:membrane protein [Streptococcus pneumoniae]